MYSVILLYFVTITAQFNTLDLLRYDMSELQEMGGGVEMWAAEAVERNQSVLLHRVKTWPQLMCCALV